jgi:hypothetical protein
MTDIQCYYHVVVIGYNPINSAGTTALGKLLVINKTLKRIDLSELI